MKKIISIFITIFLLSFVSSCGSYGDSYSDGYNDGFNAGYDEGHEAGYSEGYEAALSEAPSSRHSQSANLSTSVTQQNGSVQTYILNKSKHKFHYPDCGSVKQMKESNKIIRTDTRENIIADGYSPCGNCNP